MCNFMIQAQFLTCDAPVDLDFEEFSGSSEIFPPPSLLPPNRDSPMNMTRTAIDNQDRKVLSLAKNVLGSIRVRTSAGALGNTLP